MAKIKLEYLWLDGYKPTQNLRSKTKVEEHENFQGTIEELGNFGLLMVLQLNKLLEDASDCIIKTSCNLPRPVSYKWMVSND